MRRIPWDVLLALLVGLGMGLIYAWVISPRATTNAPPSALRADFKDQYRSVIAAAYAATGNLPRAEARLSLLGDVNAVEALNAQAQRMLAGSERGEQSGPPGQVAALAVALGGELNDASISTSTAESIRQVENTFTAASPASAPEIPLLETETDQSIQTLEIVETQPAETVSVPTPRPTRTVTPAPGDPFALAGQETVCDPNLPDGLLQILVLNPNRRQLPGIEIVITWDGGEEQFFTGLKPELGNGYADYIMSPDRTYTVQLAQGSDVALGITAPTCQTPAGETFFGSIKLTFQQP